MNNQTTLTTVNDDGSHSEPIPINQFKVGWDGMNKAVMDLADRIQKTTQRLAESFELLSKALEQYELNKPRTKAQRLAQLPYHQRVNQRNF